MPLVIQGATSGQTTLQATDAVTATITLPSATGTVQLTGGAVSATTVTASGDITLSTTGAKVLWGAGTVDYIQTNTSTHNMVINTNSVESMRINSAGGVQHLNTISVGAATPSASGAGITFPATQSASTNANTLDDYEEGTWTPTQGGGLIVVGAFSSSGRYTKVGRLVTVTGRLAGATSVATTAGTIMFTNLPFTVAEVAAVGSMTNANINTLGGVGAFTTIAYSATTIAATTSIDFSLTYSV